MGITRKDFIKQAGAISLGFSGFHILNDYLTGQKIDIPSAAEPYGSLVDDADGIFDLPPDFSYQIISSFGDMMEDGFRVPHRPDGMATFPSENGLTILIRNHEVTSSRRGDESAFGKDYKLASRLSSSQMYDPGRKNNPAQGGTTTLVYDTQKQEVVRQFLSLAGTLRNCAGGPTPWGTWLSCEEIVFRSNKRYAKDHGYVFEVKATEYPHISDPVPIKAMGRFNHEAVAVDPDSNVIYLTEDDSEGLLYRFIPNIPQQLHKGGTLQALMVRGWPSLDSRNWRKQLVKKNDPMPVEWIDLDDIDHEDLRYHGFKAGATRFARGEGMWYGNDAVYFACTNGGKKKKGQIWKYVPGPDEGTPAESERPGRLELFVEPNDGNVIENVDNLTVAPWGDLVVCEDGPGRQYLLGVTPEGEVYKLGKNAVSKSELAGAVFSPDGSTLFMNIQHEGLTLAITGPWHDRKPMG